MLIIDYLSTFCAQLQGRAPSHNASINLNIMADDARDLFNIEIDEFQKKAKVKIKSLFKQKCRAGRPSLALKSAGWQCRREGLQRGPASLVKKISDKGCRLICVLLLV